MNIDTKNPRLLRLYLWILRNGWRFIAHWIADKAATVAHTEGTWCWPCEAKARIKRDSHNRTIGPMATVYCNKCGLDLKDWRKWCSNRVEKVNYRPPKPPRHISVGWE